MTYVVCVLISQVDVITTHMHVHLVTVYRSIFSVTTIMTALTSQMSFYAVGSKFNTKLLLYIVLFKAVDTIVIYSKVT